MPELPEVETIKRDLQKAVIGLAIKSVDLRLSKILRGASPAEFERRLAGAVITDAGRRAKILILETTAGRLLIHLKMSGRLIYCCERPENKQIPTQKSPSVTDDVNEKHTHVVFFLNNGCLLKFIDMRQFGYVRLVSKAEKGTAPEIAAELTKLGPEPLELNLPRFRQLMEIKKKSNRAIKLLLMDQCFIAGIGNLYADEILFAAGIKPDRPVGSLSAQEIATLYRQIRQILKEAIKNRGTSFSLYVDTQGAAGRHQEKLQVYRRAGMSCNRCRTLIRRVKMGGRGTHYCPNCQM